MNKLRVIEAEPLGENVIERLKEALEKAEAGEVSSIAIALVYRDGSSGRSWSNAPGLSALIGATARLEAALIRDADQ